MQISHDPGSHDPDPGPQGKCIEKSCVSFETECIKRMPLAIDSLSPKNDNVPDILV